MKGCATCEYVYDNNGYAFCPYCGEELITVDSLCDLLAAVE